MGGQLRREISLEFLEGGIGQRGGENAEGGARAVEQLAGALHGDDGVLEGGGGGIVGDGLVFLQILGHALVEGGGEMLVLDLLERRQVIGQRARRKQRVRGGVGGVRGKHEAQQDRGEQE